MAPESRAVEVNAQTALIFSDPSARVLRDPDNKLAVEDALARLAEFKPIAEVGPLNQRSRYWVISELDSKLDIDRELRIDAPQWDEVRNYLIDPSGQCHA